MMPEDFPKDFILDPDCGATWRWFRYNDKRNSPVLLQCRDHGELWSFHPGSPDSSVMSWPTRTGELWPEVRAQYVAWLLTNGASQ